ncbi:hypothetical protein C7974DRAFT_436078 [Boeremia exigua]|uniref:uncharacterized protein n=1 Tax=Boeremia exigua TaxID=749465 RepID=UPI001E8CE1A0|nr:uncharacterized protein C7974DRAFT_436078 [Boeremia exigua]KAH6618684.1 hypothetical protein C7974DRAFT_436078 [Boeremia exigua]
MFYSHEVLTNRKYGVATVWLVATLGSKSSLKRITRKQMLDVDVAKACRTIVDPAAPMALRLQSNLFAHNTMMLMLRSVENRALDSGAGKTRPEQLILQDDPSFFPEFALPPLELLSDLDFDFGLDIPRSGHSQSLTPFGSRQSSQSSHVAGYGLVLPSSTPDRPAAAELEGGNGGQGGDDMFDIDNLLRLDEPDFTFGEDGDIIEFAPGQRAPAAPATPTAATAPSMHSYAGASAKVRQEHEEGLQRDKQGLAGNHMDLDLPIYRDEMPDVEVTSPVVAQQLSEHAEIVETSSSAAAPMRRKKRAAKALPRDTRLELRNTELLSWNTNYLKNMKDTASSKVQHRIQQQAKKNAEHYVWGAGIGGLGRDSFGAQGPLKQFMGDNLFHLMTGMSKHPKPTPKRDRDSGDEATQEEALRKRQKTVEAEEELGRGRDDEGLFMLGGDEEVELPREAGSALDDQQIFSAMPWNISASKRGSSAIPLSGRVAMMSEQGRQGTRAGSRMVSASPLLRRSTGRIGDFEALQSLDSDALDGNDFNYAASTSDVADAGELDTKPSQRVREALSAEGENFFAFVAEAVSEKCARALTELNEMPDADQTSAIEVGQVTFEELLPPPETSKLIACQGFLMVLSLGTKGMLDVQQANAFGDITLKPTEMGKMMHPVGVAKGDGDEQDHWSDEIVAHLPSDADKEEDSATEPGDEMEVSEPDNSRLKEQMEADDDEHDSLYDSD